MTLTKAHISNAISDQIGYPKNHSSEIVETLLELIKKALESGDDVLISRLKVRFEDCSQKPAITLPEQPCNFFFTNLLISLTDLNI